MLDAALVAALAIGLSAISVPIFFPTHDDWIVQHMFSGALAGEPVPHVPFMGYPLCWVVSELYAISPDIPWWTLLHFVVIFVSLLVAGLVTLRMLAARKVKLRRAKTLALLFVAEFGPAMPLVDRLHFTTTGSLVVSVAVYAAVAQMLLCERNPNAIDGDAPRVLAWPVIAAFMTLGYLYRAQCGYIAMGFWAICLFVAWLYARRRGNSLRGVRRIWLPFAVSCLAIAACLGIQTAVYSTPEWEATFELGDPHSAFVDYPSTPYNEDPELYESVGWDETLYDITSGYWFILDPRITGLALETINAHNDWGMRQLVEEPGVALRERLSEMKQPVATAYLVVLIGAAGVGTLYCGERRYRAVIWMTLAAAIVLLGFLFVRGRLPLRAFLSVALPALAVIGAVVLACGGRPSVPRGDMVLQRCLAPMLCGLILLFPAMSAVFQYGYTSEDGLEQIGRQPDIDAFEQYASDHPNELFIYDYWAELTPQTVWDTNWPPNATQWGGLPYFMDWFDNIMKKQGFGGTPTTATLLEDYALFVNKSDVTRDLLLEDMRNLYGSDINIEQVDTIGDGLRVYRFVRQ